MNNNSQTKRVTIKTISQKLGVSPATISKALRDSTDISADMKKKVREISDKLGYHPNLMARSLVQKRSGLLGVIIPDLNLSYYSYLVQYIYEHAQQRGYESIVMFHHENPLKERKNLEFLLSLQVDGILIDVTNGNENNDLLKQIQNNSTPIVCYDRKTNCTEFSLVSSDDCKETKGLIQSFIKDGREKIGYVGITEGNDVTVSRFEHYRKTLIENNMPFDPDKIVQCLPTIEDSELKTREALKHGLDVDALVCAGGFFAYGAGKALLSEGARLPEDVLLGEYGNNNIVQRLAISYYSTDHSPEFIAEEAVKLIDKYLQDTETAFQSQQILVPSKLIFHNHDKHDEQIVKMIN
jgi:LacI family transcriptional regulator